MHRRLERGLRTLEYTFCMQEPWVASLALHGFQNQARGTLEGGGGEGRKNKVKNTNSWVVSAQGALSDVEGIIQ